jgi:zona occludens toxin (predicted ATPase)
MACLRSLDMDTKKMSFASKNPTNNPIPIHQTKKNHDSIVHIYKNTLEIKAKKTTKGSIHQKSRWMHLLVAVFLYFLCVQ